MSQYQELVQIKPLELRFPFEFHKESKLSFHILNKTNQYVAFKVRSTNRQNEYGISPSYGLMQPGSDFNIVVTMHARTKAPADMNCNDKFQVQTVIATGSTIVNSMQDVNKIMNGSRKVHEVTLPVAYVQQGLVKGTAKRSISTIEEEEEEEEEEGKEEKGEENEENEMEALSSQDVQKMKKELAKVRKELEKNKKMVKEFQQKMGYTHFEFEELKELTDDFADSCKIGKGGFSVVYKGSHNGQQVAIKKLTLNDEKGFKEEIETLSKVRHPNIITLVGACNDKENPILVYEYLPKGSLEDHLMRKNNSPPLSGHARIRIALEICCALSFLHSIPRVHGDLKPDNILLASDFVCKLSDFGTCRKVEHMKDTMTPSHDTSVKGTDPYMDPDFIQSGKLTSWFDVYSFGVVLLRLATGKDVCDVATGMPLRESVERAIEDKNFDKLVDVEWPSKEAPEKMAKLGLRCFEPRWRNPSRPSAAELFNFLMDIASNK